MQRRTFVASALATGTALTSSTIVFAQGDTSAATPSAGAGTTDTTVETGYAPVNGLEMYYEIHGSGEPLVLLHGAFAMIALWGPILETLARSHQVIAVEFQAHGHTADIDRPFSYEQFADDVDAVMEHLGIPQADIVGYSMGANTGLQLAIRHPDRVRKLVAISATYRHDGTHPEIYESIVLLTPELFAGSPVEAAYLESALNPEGFAGLIEKMKELESNEFAWPEEDLRAITAPTQLIIADSDSVRPEHAVEMFRLLGGGVPGDLTGLPPSQLAILPGRTHITIILDGTDVLLAMIERFLAASMPEAG